MNHRVVLGRGLCALILGLGACNAKSPETTDPARTDALVSETSVQTGGKNVDSTSGKDLAAAKEPQLAPALNTLSSPHFTAFDLLTNRPLAHRIENANTAATIAVDATSADFVRYIHGNHASDWMLQAQVTDGVAAGVKGRTAQMWVPALRPDLPGGQNYLRAHVFNPAKGHNSLTVTLNGHKLPDQALKEGWQIVEVPIENAESLRADNTINMTFSNMGRINGNLSGGGFGWIRIGAPGPKPRLVAEAEEVLANTAAEGAGEEGESGGAEKENPQGSPAPRQAEGAAKSVVEPAPAPSNLPLAQGELTLENEQGLAWFVWIPAEAKLDLEIEAVAGCGPVVELFAEAGKGKVEARLKEDLKLVEGRGDVQKAAVDLGAHSGQVARLEMRPSPGCEGKPVTLKHAQLVVPGTKKEIPEVKPPKYIVFWMIDTLRADHLPIHFDTDVQAPNLKRLSEEGASFKLAYVQGTESRVSHASLFTGLYPNRHKVLTRGKVAPNVPIMSEYIKKAGYKTGVIASNGYLSHLLNLNRGWDYYTNNIHEETAVDGMFMARGGLRWADANKESPFFLYLGTIDPHVTYRRHQDIIGLYETTPYSGRYERYCSGEDLGLIKGKKLEVSARDRLRIHNLYKNEITFNDRAFGFLREQLEEMGIWDETMVIVTSDHGDEFWEHGGVGHGHNLHQELVHVPLIMYYPPLIPAQTVVDAGVDIVDVLPTILDVIDVEATADKQGKSVLPLIYNQHGGYPEPAAATQYLMHYAMQLEQWKLYLRRGDFQLYDRSQDPLEKTNVAADHPLASRWLLDSVGWFRAHREAWDKQSWGTASNVSAEFLERINEK